MPGPSHESPTMIRHVASSLLLVLLSMSALPAPAQAEPFRKPITNPKYDAAAEQVELFSGWKRSPWR